MGLSLPWHEPVLAKAVRTVYLRNAVLFQYNRLEGGLLPKHHSVPCGLSVLSIIDMYNNDVGQESAQKFMKQTGDLKAATLYFAS